uniref:Uncharacterized protein n=1 Tax=Steinernema glaseri TaxID=37863 RepID=A0A1I8A7K3_9BILA
MDEGPELVTATDLRRTIHKDGSVLGYPWTTHQNSSVTSLETVRILLDGQRNPNHQHSARHAIVGNHNSDLEGRKAKLRIKHNFQRLPMDEGPKLDHNRDRSAKDHP